MYDFAVIGLGPAGATAARLLSSRYSVLALDKKPAQAPARPGPHKPGVFTKPCGGLLAPDAQKAIAALGLTLPSSLLVDPQIFSVRTFDLAGWQGPSGPDCFSGPPDRSYQRLYLNMDRDRFDRWLISLVQDAAEKGNAVEPVQGAVFLDARRIGTDGFVLRYDAGSGEQTAKARFLVAADGAASAVRRLFFPRFRTRTYTAIQEWFSAEKTAPFYSCIFDPELTDSYMWGISKNNSFILGGAFPPEHARAAFEALKKKLAGTGRFPPFSPAKNSGGIEACQVLRPRPFGFCTGGGGDAGGGGIFCVGEAAGFVSPSSLEGISYALESARRLAQVFAGGVPPAPGRSYARAVFGIKLALFCKNLKSPFMYEPALRRLVMKSGAGAIRVFTG